jgi:hypothetical protein
MGQQDAGIRIVFQQTTHQRFRRTCFSRRNRMHPDDAAGAEGRIKAETFTDMLTIARLAPATPPKTSQYDRQ